MFINFNSNIQTRFKNYPSLDSFKELRVRHLFRMLISFYFNQTKNIYLFYKKLCRGMLECQRIQVT